MSTTRLWCLIEKHTSPFAVTIPSTSCIDEIKNLNSHDILKNFDARQLILWKIDADTSNQAIQESIDAGRYQPLPPPPSSDKPLQPMQDISDVWPDPLPDYHIQVFVGLPIGLSPTLVQSSDAPTRDLWPAVTLHATSQGNFERLDTVEENQIFELDGTEPDFLMDFRTKLARFRWIELGAEDPAVLLKNKLSSFDNYFQSAATGIEQRDRVSSELLLCHLALAFIDVAWKEGTIKEDNVRWIFDKLGWYFHSILGPRESHAFCGDWPFKMIVNVEAEQKKYRYISRNDFHVSVDGLIYLLVEVQSDEDQNDRYRMLLQAACAARLGRLIYNNPFIVVALYIENSGQVKRYFVFQRDGTDPMVSYVEDSQDWKQPFQLFKAIFEIYNLVSIIQSDRLEIANVKERIRLLASDISRNFPQTLKSKRTRCDADEDHVYQDRQVIEAFTRAGYTLESNDEDEKGWAPLNQLMPTMRHAKHSNGTAVVVKLLHSDSDELRIIQWLQSIKSPINPTIPLLGTLELNVGTFILLPEATPLDLGFRLGMFRSKAVDLSHQLIEGVAFLHRHGIAHLDIKPQNIVVLRNRLFIIDFDLSICVDGPRVLIDHWCGTPGWMAPEIGHEDGPKCLYSPILADLWSCGRVLQYLADEDAVKENPFEALTRRLLNENPRLRPLLHLQSSDIGGHSLSEPQARLKRKADTLL